MARSSNPSSDVSSNCLTKAQFLALLQHGKRAGKMTQDQILNLLAKLNPTKCEADGRKVGVHTQLAFARIADGDSPPPNKEPMGTPPQRHSWSLAHRRREPIRRGSLRWAAAAKRRAANGYNGDDDEEEHRPQLSWGYEIHTRSPEQRRAARERCASRQSSPLCSSWSVTDDDDDADVHLVAGS